MAEHLASIFGTEKDRVNCPFYFKIGACRHGDRCSRIHNKPTISQTLLLQNMYQNPMMSMAPGADGLPPQMDPRASQEHFEDFYEDVFEEMAQYGEIENLNVCDNVADHMVGSVYIKFIDEGAAALALQGLQGRFYAGRPINIEFSPVTDFREATCRQYEENTCTRGGYCNFMHLRPISRDLRKQLFGRYKRREGDGRDDRDRGRDAGRSGGGGGGRPDFQDRGRQNDRSGGRGQRESSAERRAKIASWNKEKRPEPGPPGGGGYGAPAPAAAAYGGGNTISAGPQAPYGAPPPGGYPGAPPPQGNYGGAPPTHASYGAPPPQPGGYGGVYGQQ